MDQKAIRPRITDGVLKVGIHKLGEALSDIVEGVVQRGNVALHAGRLIADLPLSGEGSDPLE